MVRRPVVASSQAPRCLGFAVESRPATFVSRWYPPSVPNANKLLTALLGFLLLCAPAYAQNGAVTWSPVLKLGSRKAIPGRLAQPFGDVFTGSVKGATASISNCNDYLRLSPEGFQPDNDQEARILHNDAVDCTALKLLEGVRKPAKPAVQFQLNDSALALLPPELAPAVSNDLIAKAKAADEAGESWQSYLPDTVAKSAGPGQLDVSQSGWKTHLTLYATGDFSRSGEEEFLIRADYQAVSGTYANSSLFLVKAGSNGAKRLRLVREVMVR